MQQKYTKAIILHQLLLKFTIHHHHYQSSNFYLFVMISKINNTFTHTST